MKKGTELKFVDPEVSNGKKFALVKETDVASEVRRWKNAVVAYFVDPDSTHNQTSFNKFIDNLMVSESRKYGDVKVKALRSGVFILDFETAQGKEIALAEGPRFYDGSKPLVLKPWSSDLSFETMKDLKSLPIWIKLPKLRLHLWSPEALSKIGSLVGRPLFTDTITASRNTLDCARICVEVEFDKNLPDSVTIIEDGKGCSYSQKVEYERYPAFICSHCLHIGHSDSCPKGKTMSSCLGCKKSDPHHLCSKQSWPGSSGFGTTGAPGANPPAYGAGIFSTTPAFGSVSTSPFGSAPGTSSSIPAFGSISASQFGSTPFSTTAQVPLLRLQSTSSSTPAFGSVSTSPFGSAPGTLSIPALGSISASPFGSTSFSSTAQVPLLRSTSSSTPAFGSVSTSPFGSVSTSPFGSAPGTLSIPALGSISASQFGSTSFSTTAQVPLLRSTSSSTPAFGSVSTSPFGSAPGTLSIPALGSISASQFGSTSISTTAQVPLLRSTSSSTPAFGSTALGALDSTKGSEDGATSLSTVTFGSTSLPTGASTMASSATDSAFDASQSISLSFGKTSPPQEEISTNGFFFR